VRAALVRSGRALAAEAAAQGRDWLADMPCGELLRAGRVLAEERGAVAAAAARVRATAAEMCGELAGLDAVMDATGEQQRRRDGMEAEIRQADDAVMDAQIKLKEIEVRKLKLMRSKRATSVAEEIAAQREAAGAELRAAFAAKHRTIDALAAIEPDFPEVLPGDSPGPPAADSVPPGARTLRREGWGRGCGRWQCIWRRRCRGRCSGGVCGADTARWRSCLRGASSWQAVGGTGCGAVAAGRAAGNLR
jgi:hypothetical protein